MGMLPTYKEIIELIKKGSTIEAQEKIAELRESVLTLRDENFNLKEEINDLRKKLEIKNKLKWDGVIYWSMDENSSDKDGPFCQRCYDVNGKLVRLQKAEYGSEYWICVECKRNYFPENYREPDL